MNQKKNNTSFWLRIKSKINFIKTFKDKKKLEKIKHALINLPDADGIAINYYLNNCKLVLDCTCGCSSFRLIRNPKKEYPRLREAKQYGIFKELDLKTNYEEIINVMFFHYSKGYLDTIDVTYGTSNLQPIPNDIEIRGIEGIW